MKRFVILALLALPFGLAARADYVEPHIAHKPFGELRVAVPIAAAEQGNGHLEARVVFYAKAPKLRSMA